MRFEMSFTLGAFDHAEDAFFLATRYLKRPLAVIQSPVSFPNGRWIGDYSDMQKALTASRDQRFSLHNGDQISDLQAIGCVNGISYWKDNAFATEVIAMEILDDSFTDLDAFIKAAAIPQEMQLCKKKRLLKNFSSV